MHPEFAPVAFIAAIFLLLPLPWHWRARNVATISIIAWLFAANIIYAVDAIIWAGNLNIVAAVWCDITTKIIIGANFALPAACLCICIHLEQVSSGRQARTSTSDKRRRRYFELSMCFGLPLIFMALHYVVQGHRFDIIEDYGCRPATYFSIPGIFIIWLPPIVVAIGALLFAGLALRHFVIRRMTFAAHLQTSNSALTTSRYLRLMAMASLQMIWSLGVTAYSLWFTVIAEPIRPWTTWSDVHSNFSRIALFPELFTPALVLRTYYILWWLVPISTFVFVAFFSFGKDAVDEYRKCISWITTHVVHRPRGFKNLKGSLSKLHLPSDGPTPISNPTLVSSSRREASFILHTLSLSVSPSPSISKTDYDTLSDTSYYPPATHSIYFPNAKEHAAELSTPSPSNAVKSGDVIHIKQEIPLEPFSPITPPVSYHRPSQARGSHTPVPPRPLTYPSYNASFDNVGVAAFRRQ